MTTSKPLAQQLINQGKSQHDVALIAGVTQPTISRLLKGISLDLTYQAGKRLEVALKKKNSKEHRCDASANI